MLKDEAYPSGWSHRRYFPKRSQTQQKNVPALDPTAAKRPHLSVASGGEPAAST